MKGEAASQGMTPMGCVLIRDAIRPQGELRLTSTSETPQWTCTLLRQQA